MVKKRTANAFLFSKKMPEGGKSQFCVTLSKLRNDANGNLRYEATVIDVDELVWPFNGGRCQATKLRFTGHCMSERDEAEWAVDYLLKTLL